MLIVTHIVMLAWVPLVVLLSAAMRKRHQSVLLVMLVGWMYLPLMVYTFVGLPEYNKVSATLVGVLLGVMLFDPHRIASFVPRWYDLPLVLFCFSVIVTSVQNGLGLYDGLSWAFNNLVLYGIPYFLGRVYFNSYEAQRDMVIAIMIAAATYAPLALFEMRFYPQLHNMVYGFDARITPTRYSIFGPLAYRPTVFMNTSFSVSMTFAMAAVLPFWLYETRSMRRFWNIPMLLWSGGFAVMTVLCKVFSGIGEAAVGAGALLATRLFPSKVFLAVLLCMPLLYMTTRTTNLWRGGGIMDVAQALTPDRAVSFETRLVNEDRLMAKAKQRAGFGWGRWNRNRVYDARGKDITRADGMWIIVFGQRGYVGLVAFTALVLLPVALVLWRCPRNRLAHPSTAPAIALSVVLCMHMIDNMANAMPNPLFTLIAGGLACWRAPGGASAGHPVPRLVSTMGTGPMAGGRRPAARRPGVRV